MYAGRYMPKCTRGDIKFKERVFEMDLFFWNLKMFLFLGLDEAF